MAQVIPGRLERGIALVVIHPAYASTRPHRCLLTRFCAKHGVSLFEAWPSLHGSVANGGREAEPAFLDFAHPSAHGHHRLALDLAAFILGRHLKDRCSLEDGPTPRALAHDSGDRPLQGPVPTAPGSSP